LRKRGALLQGGITIYTLYRKKGRVSKKRGREFRPGGRHYYVDCRGG